jgi:hypothetical protein
MVSLHKKGYDPKLISENITNVIGALENLFAGSNSSVMEVFKRKGVKYIVDQLKIADEFLKNFMIEHLSDTELKDIPKLFTDCEFLKTKISDCIPVYFDKKLSEELSMGSQGEFMNVINTSLKGLVQSGDITDRVNSRLSSIICPIIQKLSEKFDAHLKNMKSKLIS